VLSEARCAISPARQAFCFCLTGKLSCRTRWEQLIYEYGEIDEFREDHAAHELAFAAYLQIR